MKKCFCGNEHLSEYSEHYYKCDKCNVLVSKHDFDNTIYTVEEEDKDLYGENYWQEVMVKEAGVKDIDELIDMYLSTRAVYWMKNILRYSKLGAKIAEVGCGLGQLSYLFKKSGYEQTAFELSPEICKTLGEKLDINVVCGELKSVNAKFETIVSIDVFEHLLEPEQFLDDCRERLNDGGILILQTPCYDEKLSYQEMQQKKPNFEHLLVPEQHTFLFSRKAIVEMLRKHGFQEVIFEPAYFGDDYDMFLFASAKPIKSNQEEEIQNYLNKIPDGRLIKVIIRMFDERDTLRREMQEMDKQRNQQIRDIDTLTTDLGKANAEKRVFQEAAEERMQKIQELTKENGLLSNSAEERLRNINILTDENKKIKEDSEKRLRDIEQLTAMVNALQEKNQELQQAADQRLEIINQLTSQQGE